LGTFERTLTVADIYEALTANRPYRAGMPRDEAFAILDRERGDRLWAPAIDALRASPPSATDVGVT
jgi:HD-GYP domain-containing protein (c-di-GMP phosphodiesterase class II)